MSSKKLAASTYQGLDKQGKSSLKLHVLIY